MSETKSQNPCDKEHLWVDEISPTGLPVLRCSKCKRWQFKATEISDLKCDCGAPPGYVHTISCDLNRKKLADLVVGGKKVEMEMTSIQCEKGTPKPSILSSAAKLIEGDRREAYGPVEESFEKIASVWSVVLRMKVTPHQVALCMAGLKLCREANQHKEDNLIDGAAYFALAGKVVGK